MIYLIFRAITLFIYSVVLGILVSISTEVFDLIIKYMMNFWREKYFLADFLQQNFNVHTNLTASDISFLFPIVGVLLLLIILKLAKKRPQINQSDIILSIQQEKPLELKNGFLSVLGSLTSLSFGFSVGQYGPVVVMGAVLGDWMDRLRLFAPIKVKYRHISVGCAVAAAIACVFQTPIAAVIFVHEALFRFFSIRAFAPIAISAVSAFILSHFYFEREILFATNFSFEPSIILFLAVILCAISCGLCATLFIKFSLKIRAKTKQMLPSLRFVIAALSMSLLIFLLPQSLSISIMGANDLVLNKIILGTVNINFIGFLLLLLLAKFFATSICSGLGIYGGVFSPALFLGGIIGLIGSQIVSLIVPIDLTILALSSMAAFAASIMGAPISIILIIFELTGDYNLVPILMLSVVISNTISYRLLGFSSFFDALLKQYNFDTEKLDESFAEIRLDEIIKTTLELPADYDLIKAKKEMLYYNFAYAFYIEKQEFYRIELKQIEQILSKDCANKKDESERINLMKISEIGEKTLAVNSDFNILKAIKAAQKAKTNIILVENDGLIVGEIQLYDLMDKYRYKMQQHYIVQRS